MGVGVSGYGLHAVDEPVGGLAAPVAGNERPGDVGHAEPVENVSEPRAAQTEGRTEPARLGPEELLDGGRAALQFFARLLRSAEKKIRMGFGVIADGVSTSGEFLYQAGTLADKFANQEKSGVGVVRGQQIQKLRSDRGIGAVVEGQGQFPGCIGVGNDGAEKLRAGMRRAVGGHGRSAGQKSRRNNQPGIHRLYSATMRGAGFTEKGEAERTRLTKLGAGRRRDSQGKSNPRPRHRLRDWGTLQPSESLEEQAWEDAGARAGLSERTVEQLDKAFCRGGNRTHSLLACLQTKVPGVVCFRKFLDALLRTETLNPGEIKSIKAVARILIPAIAFALFFALGASSTFAQGRHPAYLHALSDLRHALALIYSAPMGGIYATRKRMPCR